MATEVNVYEAKTRLSALLAEVERGEDVVIARNGKPVARLVPYVRQARERRPGAWQGRVHVRGDFDSPDESVAWYESPVFPDSST